MSSKSKKGPKPSQPRSLEEIQRDYQNTAYRAGGAQYQVYVHTKELDTLNKRLLEINQEAALRQQLDAAAPPVEQKEESNEQQSS